MTQADFFKNTRIFCEISSFLFRGGLFDTYGKERIMFIFNKLSNRGFKTYAASKGAS